MPAKYAVFASMYRPHGMSPIAIMDHDDPNGAVYGVQHTQQADGSIIYYTEDQNVAEIIAKILAKEHPGQVYVASQLLSTYRVSPGPVRATTISPDGSVLPVAV
jgi:hypothetical protein